MKTKFKGFYVLERRELKFKDVSGEKSVHVSSAFLVLILWSVGNLKCFYLK